MIWYGSAAWPATFCKCQSCYAQLSSSLLFTWNILTEEAWDHLNSENTAIQINSKNNKQKDNLLLPKFFWDWNLVCARQMFFLRLFFNDSISEIQALLNVFWIPLLYFGYPLKLPDVIALLSFRTVPRLILPSVLGLIYNCFLLTSL